MEEWKQRLRNARLAKGLNKTQLARLVPVSNPTVTDWEKSVDDGGIMEITGPNLVKVCEVLGIDADYLMTGRQASPKASGGGSAGSLGKKIETADELRLFSAYRLCTPDEREAIDILVEQILLRIGDAHGTMN